MSGLAAAGRATAGSEEYAKARGYAACGAWVEANAGYLRAAGASPEDAGYLIALGLSCIRLGRTREAEEAIEKAVHNAATAWVLPGPARRGQEPPRLPSALSTAEIESVAAEAVEACREAALAIPSSAELMACRGHLGMLTGDHATAAEFYGRLHAIRSSVAETRLYLGIAEHRLKRYENSSRSVAAYLSVDGEDPPARLLQGLNFVALGRPREAIAEHAVLAAIDRGLAGVLKKAIDEMVSGGGK